MKNMEADSIVCTTCGANNNSDSIFCAHCGSKFELSLVNEKLVDPDLSSKTLLSNSNQLDNSFMLERLDNTSASAYALKGNRILYKIVDNGEEGLFIEAANKKTLGIANKISGILFRNWEICDASGIKLIEINFRAHWKGELNFRNESYDISAIKESQSHDHFAGLLEFQVQNKTLNKGIRIKIFPRIKRPDKEGLHPPNKFEISFDNDIEMIIVLGFAGVLIKNYFTFKKVKYHIFFVDDGTFYWV